MMDKLSLKEFMLIFRLDANSEPPSSEQVTEMHQQWGAFIGSIASQGNLQATQRLKLEGAKRLSLAAGLEDEKVFYKNQLISGYMVLKAASMEEVASIAKSCPILSEGGSVELREIAPMN